MVAGLASVACLVSHLLPGAALAETRIGVLPVNVNGDAVLGQALTTALVAEIGATRPAAEVFGPDDVRALLGATRAGSWVDISCFGAMAAGAGVDELVLANLVSLGSSDLLTLTLLDVHRNVVVGATEDREASHQAVQGAQEPLDRLASAAARLLASSRPQWSSGLGSGEVGFGRLEVLLDPWPVAAGRLDLRVAQPGALALLDDRPLQLGVPTEVAAGTHRVRVVSTDFKRAQEVMVDIKAGALKTLEIDLGKGPAGIGRLEVEAEAGTRIDLDGQTLGVAPLAPVAIAAGSHEIRLVHGARGATVQVAVTSHSTVRVAPPLVSDIQ